MYLNNTHFHNSICNGSIGIITNYYITVIVLRIGSDLSDYPIRIRFGSDRFRIRVLSDPTLTG